MGNTYVGIKCPKHGILDNSIEYASFEIGAYTISDVPCAFCQKCKCYYTTSLSIFVLTNPMLKGCRIRRGKMMHSPDKEKTSVKNTQVHKVGGVKTVGQPTIAQPKVQSPPKSHDKDTPIVTCDKVYLSNKPIFIVNKCCPQCNGKTHRATVRLQNSWVHQRGPKSWVSDKLHYCSKCESYYISPELLGKLNLKIEEKTRISFYVWPMNVRNIFCDEAKNFYYLPESYKFKNSVPEQEDVFYDMTSEDISYINSLPDSPVKRKVPGRSFDNILDWHGIEMDPYTDEANTLYVYNGTIICHENHHKIEPATAILKNSAGNDKRLNVNYCSICNKYFIHYTVYTQYRKRYGSFRGENLSSEGISSLSDPPVEHISQNKHFDKPLNWHEIDMNPYVDEDNTLYVYKGLIACIRNHHETEQATAILKDLTGNDIKLNVNHCVVCDRYFIHHTAYTQYRKRYGSILGEIKFVHHKPNEPHRMDLAEVSTLGLCGYNARKNSKLSTLDRQTIIATVIDNGAMTKEEVINLLQSLIDRNQTRYNLDLAVEKWEEDLDFTLDYNTENQHRHIIRKIVPYCRNRYILTPKQATSPMENRKCTACRFSQKTPSLIYNICTNSDAPRYSQRCEMCIYFEDKS